MFQQLVEFKKEHGHTNVPQRSHRYAELATWVRNQRAAKAHNRLIIAERGRRLDEIGFVWRLVERNAWERMFDRLVEFKKLHGHCNVPQKGGGDKLLGKWVNTQRTHFKRGTLKPERVQQLKEVGFVWNTKVPRGESR
ncbi:MAG TPA: helicase associated domain-containing protein [Prosthecobacter sp.]|nr:helicase associated domain-containing protein [Prosthecobacter sp.]HRK15098.1 helicase associated domain-containing protein [Prosthecobacter sp.]